VQAYFLLAFGIVLTRVAFTDALLNYVRPSTRPWMQAAGITMLLLGVAVGARREWAPMAVAEGVTSGPAQDAGGPRDPRHHHPGTRVAWLVLAPVIAIVVFAPPALGAYTARRPVDQASIVAAGTTALHPLPTGAGPARLSMYDFLRRALDDSGQTLRGHDVVLTGFVSDINGHTFVLNRLVIFCCAADAIPIRVRVHADGPAPADGAWLEVTGTFTGIAQKYTHTPALTSSHLAVVPRPSETYDH
jgi:uncharacterized repeat protein (TIGR03943 family)